MQETREERPTFGGEREADYNKVLTNQGGTGTQALPPRNDLPPIAKQIPDKPPEDFPKFDAAKPDADRLPATAGGRAGSGDGGAEKRLRQLNSTAVAARFSGLLPSLDLFAGWRGLRRFWIGLLLLLGIGAGVLQILGPSARLAPIAVPVAHNDPVPATHGPQNVKGPVASKQASVSKKPGRDTPGPVAGPDPTLLEPYSGSATLKLPRISPDGRTPMAVYASGFDPSSVRPRVGLLITGIGMSEAESLAAIKNLPGGVTLAISPYAGDLSRLLDAARINEHEYLLSVPMEPQGYPVNDPDDRYALMTALPPAENLNRLRWVLSRITGYVGLTNGLGQMRGERLSGVQDQIDSVLEEAAHRGLLFVDARTGQPVSPYAWNRPADLLIDEEPIDAATLDKRLDTLTKIALNRGSALGIVSVPRPLTLERVAAWTGTLLTKGLALAPVSALALPPAKEETGK